VFIIIIAFTDFILNHHIGMILYLNVVSSTDTTFEITSEIDMLTISCVCALCTVPCNSQQTGLGKLLCKYTLVVKGTTTACLSVV